MLQTVGALIASIRILGTHSLRPRLTRLVLFSQDLPDRSTRTASHDRPFSSRRTKRDAVSYACLCDVVASPTRQLTHPNLDRHTRELERTRAGQGWPGTTSKHARRQRTKPHMVPQCPVSVVAAVSLSGADGKLKIAAGMHDRGCFMTWWRGRQRERLRWLFSQRAFPSRRNSRPSASPLSCIASLMRNAPSSMP